MYSNFENSFLGGPKSPEFGTVGGASEEEKEKSKEKKIKALNTHGEFLEMNDLGEIKEYEYEKTEDEIELIQLANEEVNEFMKKVGVEPYDIPIENYHLLSEDDYEEHSPDSIGMAIFSKQAIVLNADKLRRGKMPFFSTVVHETFHLKGKMVLEVSEDEEDVTESLFRGGLSVYSSQKKDGEGDSHSHFLGAHEAITDKVTKRILRKNIENNPLFKEEKEFLNSEEMEKRKEESDIPNELIYWVDKEGGVFYDDKQKEQEVIDYVCEKISEENPQDFPDETAVFDQFLKAHFSGRLLPLARATEKTFGKGSFRVLGNMKTDGESATLVLEELKKRRGREASNR